MPERAEVYKTWTDKELVEYAQLALKAANQDLDYNRVHIEIDEPGCRMLFMGEGICITETTTKKMLGAVGTKKTFIEVPAWQVSVGKAYGGTMYEPPGIDYSDLGKPHERYEDALLAAVLELVRQVVVDYLHYHGMAKEIAETDRLIAEHGRPY